MMVRMHFLGQNLKIWRRSKKWRMSEDTLRKRDNFLNAKPHT